jgi:hypothetical protein
MVPSITDWLNELLTTGVTELYGTIARDLQTGVAQITLRPLDTATLWPDRLFAAYGGQLLPLDGVQTFSEIVMRSEMTDARKVEWLFTTCQEYEQKCALVVEKRRSQQERG